MSKSSHANNRRNFISLNDGFICENCGKKNEPQQGSCRNHCVFCLYSKHVDDKIPGDRASKCKGLMQPIEVDHDGKKGYVIIHKCMQCGKVIRNRVALDDDFDAIIQLSLRKGL